MHQAQVEQLCHWILTGIDRPGIYLVFPWKLPWHLVQHRQVPWLQVKGYQIPTAPAFAMTAHASECKNVPAAIIDLQIGRVETTLLAMLQ